jgi:DNA-binding MarR family transcriptional regulator
MILIKQIAVYLNLGHCKFKQFISEMFKNESINLTPEQFLLIDMLWKEDLVSQQQLANILMKDKNSITKLIDGMEVKGYLKRVSDENDRRLKLIALTPLGKSLEKKVTEVAVNSVNSIITGIEEEELNTFVKVLKVMSQNVENIALKGK